MDRFRTFFLTINKSAQCYETLLADIKKNIGGDDTYAIIKHDKDIVNEDDVLKWEYNKDIQFSDDSEAPVIGDIKQEHYHLMLEFKNARTFKTIQRIFPGAHIERPISKQASYQYLIHKNHKEKYQYKKSEIVSNNYSYILIQIGDESLEPFDPNKILYYHIHPKYNLKNLIAFYGKFGKQINHYKNLINEIISNYKLLDQEEKFEIDNKTLYNEQGELQ